MSAAGDICEPNLTEGVSVNATGEIVADKTGSDTDTAIAAAREEGRAEGVASVDVTTDNQAAFDEGSASVDITTDNEAAREEGRTEGVASVTPLNCAEGTTENEAGDACEPTAEYRAAAVEEGRAAGIASVTPLNCGDGTAVNDAGDACVPTAEYRAAAVEEGRAAGIASVTPLNCGDGTAVNDAGDACEPTAEYRAAAVKEGRLAGVASVDITSNDADVVAAATADLFTQAELDAARQAGVDSVDITSNDADVIAAATADLFTQAELDAARQAGVDSVDITSNDADVIAAATADLFTQAELDAARQAGADSVTPLNCAEGTAENDAGDACEPNLSVDVAIDDENIIVPTDAYAAQVCADAGGTFDAATNACAPAYDCFLGGYCSEAASILGYGSEQGNLYDGDTFDNAGCGRTQVTATLWFMGRDRARAGSGDARRICAN